MSAAHDTAAAARSIGSVSTTGILDPPPEEPWDTDDDMLARFQRVHALRDAGHAGSLVQVYHMLYQQDRMPSMGGDGQSTLSSAAPTSLSCCSRCPR